MTSHLEKLQGGYWLCNIKPADIESGLIKCEYKGFTLNFVKGEIAYQVQIC